VFEQPAEWSEVLIRFTLIWMVFMGAPTAFRQGRWSASTSPTGCRADRQARADWIVAVAALVLIGFMIRYGFDYSYRARCRRSAASNRCR
jgi:TRAP-type C4-dicarboxylate transport system permease small subunit